jgi:hypothetical protein
MTVPQLPDADIIWNRAAMEDGGRAPSEGDSALAAVLEFHSLAMSGGVLDAIERLAPDHFHRAAVGFRWFGLDAAASFLDGAAEMWRSADENSEMEELEFEFDDGYSSLIPDDATLVAAFHDRLVAQPTAFSPPE